MTAAVADPPPGALERSRRFVLPELVPGEDDVAFLMYTSGTTAYAQGAAAPGA